MIIDDIKKINIQAMKDRDVQARNILGILLNKVKLAEIAKRGLEDATVSDAEVAAILQKTVKELNEEMEAYKKAGYADRICDIERQLEVVQGFLPKMLTKEQITEIISKLDDKSMPFVMKYFKANYNGQCDMTLVKECCN